MATDESNRTLEELWEEAQIRFKTATDGLDIKRPPSDLESILTKLESSYTSKEAPTKKKAKRVVDDVLRILKMIGDIAGQALSTVFSPASMCFNAVSYLIDGVERAKSYRSGLIATFEAIQSFLMEFRMLQRIEGRFKVIDGSGLPPEMIKNTNELMCCFVDMCAYAYKAMNRGKLKNVLVMTRVALADDDSGISAQLEKFKGLVEQQNFIKGTVTLEEAKRNGENIEHLLVMVTRDHELFVRTHNDVGDIRRKLEANDNKSNETERLDRIASKLGLDSGLDRERERPRKSGGFLEDYNTDVSRGNKTRDRDDDHGNIYRYQSKKLKDVNENRLPGTCEWLERHDTYVSWRDSLHDSGAVLFIGGSQGTGKSFLASNVIEKLRKADAPDRPTAVAYYFFPDRNERRNNPEDGDGARRIFSEALRCMAYTLAKANTKYARELENNTEWRDGPEIRELSCERLWQVLGFSDPRSTSFVLVFDGLDQLTNSEEFIHIIRLTDKSTRNSVSSLTEDIRSNTSPSTQPHVSGVRVLATVDEDRVQELEDFGARCVRIISTEHRSAGNNEDLELYMDNMMKTKGGQLNDMARSPGHKHLFEDFRKHLLEIARGRFSIIRSRIQRVRQQLEEVVENVEDLKPVMFSKEDDDRSKLIEQDLESVTKALWPRDITQVNKILTWIVWSDGPGLSFEEIDAIAVLNKGPAEPWRSFTQKIKTKSAYDTLFRRSQQNQKRILDIDKDMLEYLRQTTRESDTDDLESVGSNKPKIDLTINITQADPKTVKRFLWDLQEKISFDRSFFAVQGSEVVNRKRIHVDEAKSISSILIQCLNLLNEEPTRSTEELLGHASDSIPFYIWRATQIEHEQRKVQARFRFPAKDTIILKLVAFLSHDDGTESILATKTSDREPWSNWLKNRKYRDAIAEWLNKDMAQQLEPEQKRNLLNLLDSDGPNAYLRSMVKRIARVWLVAEPDWGNKGKILRAFHWVDTYFSSRNEHALAAAEGTFADNLSGKTEVERSSLILAERVWQTAELAQKLLALEKKDSRFFERVGIVYMKHGLAPKAIEMYKLSMKDSNDPEIAYIGMAESQYTINQPDKARYWAEKAIEVSRDDQKNSKAADRRLQYQRVLGVQYILMKKFSEAVKTFEDIIEHDHQDWKSHIWLFRVLNASALYRDGAEILNRLNGQLVETREGNKDKTRLAEIIRITLEEKTSFDHLAFLPELAQRTGKLDLMDQCLQEVLLHFREDEDDKRHIIGLLMAYQGLMLAARDKSDEGYEKAFEAWSDALQYLSKGQERDDPDMSDTRATIRRLCAGYHFAQLKSSENRDRPLKSIKELYKSAVKYNSRTRMKWTFASAHSFVGNEEEAKAVLKQDFDEAFEILNDDDPSNDLKGYMNLTRACAHIGDIQNALVAFSLAGPDVERYDREKEQYDARLASKQTGSLELPSREDQPASEQDITAEAVTTEVSNEGTSVGDADEVSSEPGDEALKAPEYRGKQPQSAFCDGGCNKWWEYPDDMWVCTFCESTCFCGPCHDEVVAGTKWILKCHRSHDFFHMPTWKRSEYERIGKGNVSIPKKVANGEGDDGVGEWSFTQGEIVSISEWEDRVKKKWGLKEEAAAESDNKSLDPNSAKEDDVAAPEPSRGAGSEPQASSS